MRGVEYRDDRNRWACARLARSAIEGQRQRTEPPFADPAYGVHAYYRLRDSTPGRSQRCDGGDATSRVCRTAMPGRGRNLRRCAVGGIHRCCSLASLFGSYVEPIMQIIRHYLILKPLRPCLVRAADLVLAGGSVLHSEMVDRKSNFCTWGCIPRPAGCARF